MIWITGARGMLGRELSGLLEADGRAWVGTDREVDLTDRAALERFALERFARERFGGRGGAGLSWIVNCAAYTQVDRAEQEPAAAWAINADAPGHLAALARARGAGLIHLSTDYVFDGGKEGPYLEEDPVGPLSAYARGKAEGESRVRMAGGRYLIVRTAWMYGRHGPNFVTAMLSRFRELEEVGVVADQWGSPTWARDLAGLLLRLCRTGELAGGIYHFTNSGRASWYEYAGEIQRRALGLGLIGHPVRLKPLSSDEYRAGAHRPANSQLSLEKIRSALGLTIRPWQEALGEYLGELAREGKMEGGSR
jgi:dTDP-4-dehydrorhamnose reductase